jgi:hypothetical protein
MTQSKNGTTNVALQDGSTSHVQASTVADLKRQISELIGVEPDQFAIADQGGTVVAGNHTPPSQAMIVPHQGWGGLIEKGKQETYFHELDLMRDLLCAMEASGFQKQYRVKLLKQNQLNPFRLYLLCKGQQYPVKVTLKNYPLTDLPDVVFENRIPPCPIHDWSWHANVYGDGKLCWGTVSLLPGTTLTGLINTLVSLLQNPNHLGKIKGRCE